MTNQAGEKKKPGRPSILESLSEETIEAVMASIRAGNFIKTACLANGVPYHDYVKWQKWGKEGREPYAGFFRRCARARAQAEEVLVATAQSGDEKGVSYGPSKAAAWMLERTRGDFAPHVKLNLEKQADNFLEIAERVLEPDQFNKLIEAIAAAESSAEEARETSPE